MQLYLAQCVVMAADRMCENSCSIIVPQASISQMNKSLSRVCSTLKVQSNESMNTLSLPTFPYDGLVVWRLMGCPLARPLLPFVPFKPLGANCISTPDPYLSLPLFLDLIVAGPLLCRCQMLWSPGWSVCLHS